MATVIEIDGTITVGDLAEKLMLPVTKLITELMKNGLLVTVNETIDFDTAHIIVSELGLDIELVKKDTADSKPVRERVKVLDGVTRPPVVAVMGHVDHGKTSLLDAIRGAEVVKNEAGGITQHISAYQVHHQDRLITFLDTPGHEAFAALREHGAQLTDVAIIVVAADDGMKPQTLEAIRFARKAGVKIVVAINKIDKEGADINRIKQQMSEQGLLVEEWGGETIVVPVSAKTKQGIPELLDMILLVADVEELKARVDTPAAGLVIESHMEQGRGSVAIALVEEGVLKKGDFIVAGSTYAKVRNLETTTGEVIDQATPSTPVVMTGFKELPDFGDTFVVALNERDARSKATQNATRNVAGKGQVSISSTELLRRISRSHDVSELKVLIKADVQGSLTSVIDSLKTLDTDEVKVRIISSGVGTITDNDIHLAATSGAIIYGFDVVFPSGVKQLASRDKVPVRLYKVIYELIDDVKKEMSGLLAPQIVETQLGRLQIKGIFKQSRTETICGGEVTKGKLKVPAFVRVMRDKEVIDQVEAVILRRGPQETKEVVEGEMCGVSLKTETRLDLALDDRLEFYTVESVERTL